MIRERLPGLHLPAILLNSPEPGRRSLQTSNEISDPLPYFPAQRLIWHYVGLRRMQASHQPLREQHVRHVVSHRGLQKAIGRPSRPPQGLSIEFRRGCGDD